MVKSELHQLEKLIEGIVSDEKIPGKERHPVWVAEQLQSVTASCTSLKEKWVHELFSSVKEPVVTRYVQYHQAGITSISDEVGRRIVGNVFQGVEKPINHLYATVVSKLEELLQFLKQRFYKYFDLDHGVSNELCRVQTGQILLLLEETKAIFTRQGVDSLLAAAIIVSVKNKIEDAKRSGISYRQLDDCKSFLNTIRKQAEENLTTAEFAQELYRQNFNSYHFTQWYQEQLGIIINAVPENKKEEAILREMKLLQLIFVERDKIFEPELPPVHEQLLSWLAQLLPVHANVHPNEFLKTTARHRMPLQFSVTQFALFVRLCYLEGCFHLNNISDIFRFFTQHFETKKQLNISLKSFSRAFYGVDQATAAVVRDLLQRMINTIDKIYFP